MKTLFCAILFSFLFQQAIGQDHLLDSLKLHFQNPDYPGALLNYFERHNYILDGVEEEEEFSFYQLDRTDYEKREKFGASITHAPGTGNRDMSVFWMIDQYTKDYTNDFIKQLNKSATSLGKKEIFKEEVEVFIDKESNDIYYLVSLKKAANSDVYLLQILNEKNYLGFLNTNNRE